jgi:hypothetical protein
MTIRPVVSSLRGAGPREWSGRLPRVFGLELDTASFYPRLVRFATLASFAV